MTHPILEDEKSSREEEMASLCLMAKNDSSTDEEVNPKLLLDEDDMDMSFEDLYEMFTNLYEQYKAVKKEKKILSKNYGSLLDTLEENSKTIHDQSVCVDDLYSRLKNASHSTNMDKVQPAIIASGPCDHVETMDALQLKLDVLQDQYDSM